MAMIEERSGETDIASEEDIVIARRVVREVATALGFGLTDVTRIVTAASELARNIHLYAGSGVMRWSATGGESPVVELTFEDNGPGIAAVDQALERGFTTSGGLGLGLPGVKRLMDEMEIQSEVGVGTTVTVKKRLRRR